jgi:hypothetical protein
VRNSIENAKIGRASYELFREGKRDGYPTYVDSINGWYKAQLEAALEETKAEIEDEEKTTEKSRGEATKMEKVKAEPVKSLRRFKWGAWGEKGERC